MKNVPDVMNPIEHWAYVRAMLYKERERVLRSAGLNERTYYELESQAVAAIPGDYVDTDFGRVSKKYMYVNPEEPETSARCVSGLILSQKTKEK